MLRVITFTTREEKMKGISGMSPVPKDALFVFQDLEQGSYFHSQGVLEDFEIVFLNDRKEPMYFAVMHPERQLAIIPAGATTAVESAVGVISGLGFRALASIL